MAAAKMLELDLPFELHLFQGGEHGMSVCNSLDSYQGPHREEREQNPNVGMWVPMCTNWINRLFSL